MSNYKIIPVNEQNISLLKIFIDQIGTAAETFRYFNNRQSDVISKHLTTLLLLHNDLPLAYGHLEEENKIVWLGICVLPGSAGKGLGKLMMHRLVETARQLNLLSIQLTVDKPNIPAIKLYEQFNFRKTDETGSYFKYLLFLH